MSDYLKNAFFCFVHNVFCVCLINKEKNLELDLAVLKGGQNEGKNWVAVALGLMLGSPPSG
jgi:hypothetical protein